MDALFAKARLHATVGDCVAATAAYEEILAKEKTSTGKKIDATLEQARVAFFSLVRTIYMSACLSVSMSICLYV
jgi:hypothetical protein